MSNRLWQSDGGSAAIVFGVMAVPVVLAVGLAIDYAAMSRDRSIVQGVADRAVLAAGQMIDATDAEITATIAEFIETAEAAKGVDRIDRVTVTFPGSDRIRVSVEAHKPTSLFNVMTDRFPYTVTNESFRGLAGKLEVALVLDTTRSMQDSKITALKDAAKSLVDNISTEAGSAAKFSLVPFAEYVNIGRENKGKHAWLGTVDEPFSSSKCTKSSATVCGPLISDKVLVEGAESCTWAAGDCIASNVDWAGCVGSRNSPLNLEAGGDASSKIPAVGNVTCGRTLVPLTTEVSKVKNEIDKFTVNGQTYIPAGLLWGFNMLTPGAPLSNASAFDPDGQNLRPHKAVVLMTDGDNTRSALPPMHNGSSTAAANKATADLCDNIKAKNIAIYTVAFQVSDDATKTLLRNCATDTDRYFSAEDEANLVASFLKIAKSLKQVRLSQ